MIHPHLSTKIYLAMTPVDMRKACDGLSVLVAEALKQDPRSGHLFIFYNRARNKIKCLFWDRNGFALYYKRLEKHSFKIPRPLPQECVLLDQRELHWLLAGLDFSAIRQRPDLQLSIGYQ